MCPIRTAGTWGYARLQGYKARILRITGPLPILAQKSSLPVPHMGYPVVSTLPPCLLGSGQWTQGKGPTERWRQRKRVDLSPTAGTRIKRRAAPSRGGYHYPVGLVSSGVTALSGWSVRAAIVPWVTDRWVRPCPSLSAPSRTTCLVDGSLLLAPMLTGFVSD